MSISLPISLTRTAVIHGAVLGLTAALIGSALAASQETPTGRPVPPPPSEKPNLPAARPTAPPTTPSDRLRAGWSAHPLGAVDCTAAVPENTIWLFKDANFKDNFAAIENVTGQTPGGSHSLPNGLNDDMTSLRWNLPPGVIVVFYEDGSAKGEQVAIWGKGEMPSVSRWNINDKVTSWAWYYAGGYNNASVDVQRGAGVRATGAESTAATIGGGSLQLFRDKNFKGEMVPVSDITAEPAGALNKLPHEMNDKITSMRWNLPAGAVVVFYQDGQGEKQQAAIWGVGEVKDVDVWDFNDKISRWAWYYIGSQEVPALGYTPPSKPLPGDVVPATGAAADLVAKAIEANKLGITSSDLMTRRNPTGEGTFVYVPKTSFDGVERRLIWIVVDNHAYAITGPAKMVTPTLSTPAEAEDAIWSKTGLDKMHAEDDAVKVVFK